MCFFCFFAKASCLHRNEVSDFDDIIMHGVAQAQPASVALLYSQTSDTWLDGVGTIGAHKKAMYLALRHLQMPIDVVIEEDALSGALRQYTTLYITEPHISEAAGAAIAQWVRNDGGVVFATAGAGLRNEFNITNQAVSALLGVTETATRSSAHSSGVRVSTRALASVAIAIALPGPFFLQELHWLKDDLPFSIPLDHVSFQPDDMTAASMPALGRISVFTPTRPEEHSGEDAAVRHPGLKLNLPPYRW